MTRADELHAVARQLVLLTAIVESLASSLQSPQDGPELEDDAPVVPVDDRGAPGKGNATASGTAASPGNLPAHPERPMDRTGLPLCTCPPCVTERAEGRRP